MTELRDAVYGLAVGDALGLPVQFRTRDSYVLDHMIGFGTFHLPAGSWSDDTSLTLATCDSIRQKGCVDVADIRKKFEDWYYRGAYTPFGQAYDIGITCGQAIVCGEGIDEEYSCGNGSLMRMIPLAFVDGITEKEVTEIAAITHAHTRTIEGCVAYVNIAKGLLAERLLKDCVLEYISEQSDYVRLRHIEELPREKIKSSGYVVDTFEAAIWCLLTTNTYKECLLKAVNLGEDTDTVGAVAGGLAGIIYGLVGIPEEWVEMLQARGVIEESLC